MEGRCPLSGATYRTTTKHNSLPGKWRDFEIYGERKQSLVARLYDVILAIYF